MLEGWFGRIVVLELKKIYIWYFEEQVFYECRDTRSGSYSVFFLFDCEGPNPKYEKLIKMKGTVPGFFFEVLSKCTVFEEQFDGFFFIGILNQEKWDVNILKKGESLMLAKEI